jgi:lysophospholipase L1-like esterase
MKSSFRWSFLALLALVAGFLFFPRTVPHAEENRTLQILLMGDSTCEESIPKKHNPAGPHHEDIIRLKLAEQKDLPPTNVINKGQSGEYIERLFKRYDKDIAKIPGADYILIRYGINDFAHRENFAENFPKDYHELIARLHKDFPKAQIILMTVIPFSKEETSEKINALVKQVAAEEKLPLFDLYPLYDAALKKYGANALNYRRFPLDKIPEADRDFVKPYVTDNPPTVEVMDQSLDERFGKLPGWYHDRHPNEAGYKVIGEETANYLAPLIRGRK